MIDALQGETGGALWLAAWVTVAIGAPLAEEFLFRVTLQGWFYRFFGTWYEAERRAHPAPEGEDDRPHAPPFWLAAMPVLASSVAFAAVHARHGMAPIALFPLALTLGVLYHRTRRLMPCVICHAAFNAMNLALLPLH